MRTLRRSSLLLLTGLLLLPALAFAAPPRKLTIARREAKSGHAETAQKAHRPEVVDPDGVDPSGDDAADDGSGVQQVDQDTSGRKAR